MVVFTFVLYILCVFFLFMIFMNFIIAVIGESNSKVIEKKEAYDYFQRAGMIYEREVHFSEKVFENSVWFPKFLIIRKKKETNTHKNTTMGMIASVKIQLKTQIAKLMESM